MSRHKAAPEQNPLLLVGAFVVIAALLFGIFRLATPGDQVKQAMDETSAIATTTSASVMASDPPSATPSATPSGRSRRDLAVAAENIQPGQVVGRIPKPVCRQVPVDVDITVLSYNIKSARIGGGIGAYLNIIRSSGADVVLLQEVDMNRRGTRINQPAWLAENLGGWDWAFGKNVSYGATSGYGTAIVSKYPIVSWHNTHLPNGPGGQQRGLLKAVADVHGVDVSFYSTHLQNQIDYLKVRQAQAIAPIVSADPNPKVLGGDMNSHQGDAPLRALEGPLDDTWGAVGVGDGRTHPANRLRGRIDFLMHGGSGITPVTSDVLGYTNSDHRPVRATYDVDGVTEEKCTRPKG